MIKPITYGKFTIYDEIPGKGISFYKDLADIEEDFRKSIAFFTRGDKEKEAPITLSKVKEGTYDILLNGTAIGELILSTNPIV